MESSRDRSAKNLIVKYPFINNPLSKSQIRTALQRETLKNRLSKLGMKWVDLERNKTQSLIDTIASYNGYERKNSLCKLTHLLSYTKSRDAD